MFIVIILYITYLFNTKTAYPEAGLFEAFELRGTDLSTGVSGSALRAPVLTFLLVTADMAVCQRELQLTHTIGKIR